MNRIVTTLLAAGLVVSGCGGGSDGERTASPSASATPARSLDDLEACELVTKAEVGAALGSPVGDGEERGLVGCGWKAESAALAVMHLYAGSMFTPKTCEAQKALVSGRQEALTGIGDSALWGSSGDLVVCAGQIVIKVDVDNTPHSPDQDREAAMAIARAALGRL